MDATGLQETRRSRLMVRQMSLEARLSKHALLAHAWVDHSLTRAAWHTLWAWWFGRRAGRLARRFGLDG